MTDINNIGKPDYAQSVNFEGNSPSSQSEVRDLSTEKEIKDLDKSHSAVVGRSMVQKMPKFDGRLSADIKNDLAELNADYATNKQAMAIADLAMQKGIPYEKALKIAEEYISLKK